MIRWVREHDWLPEVLLFVSLFLLLGGADLVISGPSAWIPAVVNCAAVLFIRKWQFLAPVLIVLSVVIQLLMGLGFIFSSLAPLLTVMFQAAFCTLLLRQIVVFASTFAGISGFSLLVFRHNEELSSAGLTLSTDNAKLVFLAICTLLTIALNSLAWIAGRLLITRFTHVGTATDRAATLHEQARLSIEVARQTERLGIARDLTDLLVQRVSAVVSLVQGAKYSAKLDADSALRSIERIDEFSSSAQQELRRLYDMLNEDHKMTTAPPRLQDLEPMIIAMRELGYNATLQSDGIPFEINEGAELCIFKIIFEALDNVKKNAVAGTSVTVDLFWTASGLQVLVKDNGIETSNRKSGIPLGSGSYTAEEDLDSLIEIVDGATIRVLRERAALYEGSIEASRTPGVGFTLSAIFPNLKATAGV
jgi:signal transduction histidine kinase